VSDRIREDDAVVLECELDEPPDKVWRALSEPDLRAAWLGETEAAQVEVLAATPGERLDLAWRADDGDSRVSFEIGAAAGGGTRLKIIHRLAEPAAIVTALPAHETVMIAANDRAWRRAA
jgi:uncharacterized protein YndB with AHSA1/START domain